MKPPNTQSAAPPDTNEYSPPAVSPLETTPHPVIEAEQRAGQVVARVMAGVSTMLAEHMRGIKLELRAVTNDNSVMRQNLALMNTALADFQRNQVIPLRSELANLNGELGSTTIENNRKLEGLIQALTRTVDAAGGLIPADLKQQILDGRFENLEHRPEGSMVDVAEVQAMIEAAYIRGRADAQQKVPS